MAGSLSSTQSALCGFIPYRDFQGFWIGFSYPLKPACKNLTGELYHPQVIEENLAIEILDHHVAGPFNEGFLPLVKINRS